MSDWVSYPEAYLGLPSMRNNAAIIVPYFQGLGWTDNAIAGMLGNMQTESTINPGLWQGRYTPADPLTTEQGYGLTQWTPASKLINWATENGLDYMSGDVQMQRIKYERENNLQWSTNNILNYTWDEYVVSTESPETLARVWVWAYERPTDPNIPQRQEQARYWYNFIKELKLPVWLLFKIKEVNRYARCRKRTR